MKNGLTGVALVALVAGLTACSSDEFKPSSQDGQIRLTSYVALTRASQELQSTQIAEGVQVGVFATNADGDYISNGNNNLMVADGAGSFTTTTQMYWPSAGSANIYAYAPYNSSWSSQGNQSFIVSTDQSEAAGYLASDLIFGLPTSNPVAATENAVPLVFKHKLSKVNITLVSNDDAVSFNNSTVSLVNVANQTEINLTTGDVDAYDAEGSVNVKAAVFGDNESEYKCAAVIVPQTVAAGNFIQIVTADKAYSCSLASDMEFQSGLVYNFTVTLNGNQADLNLDSTITDWEDGGSSNLDPEEIIPPVVYEVGDYLLEDGTMVKKAKYTSGTIIGCVFSTEVSEADAAAGYTGYIVGVKNALTVGQAQYGVTKDNLFADALCDKSKDLAASLDGLTITKHYIDNASYGTETGSVFYKASQLEQVAGDYSQWFVPTMGQMMQLFANLGGASFDLSETTTVNTLFSATATGEVDSYTLVSSIGKDTLISNLSSALGLTLGNTAAYLSSSYRGVNYPAAWLVQFKASTIGFENSDDAWAFNTTGLAASGCRALFCVAYK